MFSSRQGKKSRFLWPEIGLIVLGLMGFNHTFFADILGLGANQSLTLPRSTGSQALGVPSQANTQMVGWLVPANNLLNTISNQFASHANQPNQYFGQAAQNPNYVYGVSPNPYSGNDYAGQQYNQAQNPYATNPYQAYTPAQPAYPSTSQYAAMNTTQSQFAPPYVSSPYGQQPLTTNSYDLSLAGRVPPVDYSRQNMNPGNPYVDPYQYNRARTSATANPSAQYGTNQALYPDYTRLGQGAYTPLDNGRGTAVTNWQNPQSSYYNQPGGFDSRSYPQPSSTWQPYPTNPSYATPQDRRGQYLRY